MSEDQSVECPDCGGSGGKAWHAPYGKSLNRKCVRCQGSGRVFV